MNNPEETNRKYLILRRKEEARNLRGHKKKLSMHKGKGNKDECNIYRGMRLLISLGYVCGRVLMERMMKVTEGKVSMEQGGFLWTRYLLLKLW